LNVLNASRKDYRKSNQDKVQMFGLKFLNTR
jgi:hypothetical protein